MNNKSFKIVFLLIALLLSIEIVLRVGQSYLSKDIKHYEEMDSIVKMFDKSKAEKVLFIGNSLTREGIDKEKLEERAKEITLIRPDDTSITEWFWIFKSKIYDENIKVKNLAIVFVGDQLEDKRLQEQNLVSVGKIIRSNALLSVRDFEGLGLSDLITLTLTHISVTFASRERVQRRVFDLLPKYREQSRIVNQNLVKNHIEDFKDKKKIMYKHLHALIRLAEEKKIHITFIAAPLPKIYALDPDLSNIIKQSDLLSFIDAREEAKVDKTDFKDGYHLNEKGAAKFTQYIIERGAFSF